jgi:UDP-N-acetylmuramoyl-tripeptide--D-alanyl-D-alanine ligase
LSFHKPTILGITGSYGKTTTRHLVAHVLGQQFSIFTPPRSHNTPLSTAWPLLKNYQGEELVFLEYAAYKKGEIKRLAKWFPPQVSLITGVTKQHLALFGSLEKIIEAKGELVKATRLDGQVFYNGSDPQAIKVCDQDSSKPKTAYSDPESGNQLTNASLDEKGRLQFTWQGKSLRTHLVGLHNLQTVQAAIAVAEYFKVPIAKIRTALTSFLPTNNYVQVYPHPRQQYLIINDGDTSNPKGFLAALEILKHFKKTGKNTILLTSGILDLGDESDEIHLNLAKEAKALCDLVLYTGVDGRHVFKEVFGANMTSKTTTIKTVISKLNDNDVLLVEGNVPKWLKKELERLHD